MLQVQVECEGILEMLDRCWEAHMTTAPKMGMDFKGESFVEDEDMLPWFL